jgi:penicillin-binding protein 2
MKRSRDVAFEDALHDDWSRDAEVVEVPIGNSPLFYLSILITVIAAAVAFKVIYLNFSNGSYYAARAAANAGISELTPAPRGLIYDREGNVLAENQAAFAAILDPQSFLKNQNEQSSTLSAIQNIFGIVPDDVWTLVSHASVDEYATPIVLSENITQSQLVNVQALSLDTIRVESDFERTYPQGRVFSSILGYAGRVNADDLQSDPSLDTTDIVGKVGLEAYYDSSLQGTPGIKVVHRNAVGNVLDESVKTNSQIGTPLHLTIDGGLQSYFYQSIQNELGKLNRSIGVGIAMNPQTGEVLSLVNLPGYDNNLFSGSGNSAALQELFNSPEEPLFNRAISGMYNPGSTIKPLDGVAGLKEGVMTPLRSIFSPGYLLVPNPYNSSTPTKYLDWQYQGTVDLASALAQSSDVYFYLVGGGSPAASPELNDPSDYGISGLGINRLNSWWQKFGLGKPTGIDLPGEQSGFLPTPAWKKQKTGKDWLLGDTYNVSIGQGDLLLTPIQLLDYIGAIANGGKVYRPFLNANSTPQVSEDLTDLLPQIQAVQEGMRETVTAPKGTAHTMNDLPFPVCAKTGSAQIHNNQEENALFVGYAPCDPANPLGASQPQIAVLVLIENSVQGSLNAVPIAKDVMNWYWQNRLNSGR